MLFPEGRAPPRRRFNVAGPCDPRAHYMLPPLPRLAEARVHLEAGDYFVLHAPSTWGKTTFLQAFAEELTEAGQLAGVYASCESAEAKGDDELGTQALLVSRLIHRAGVQLPEALRPPPFTPTSPDTRLRDFLASGAQASVSSARGHGGDS